VYSDVTFPTLECGGSAAAFMVATNPPNYPLNPDRLNAL
jgi:hypothetical protein